MGSRLKLILITRAIVDRHPNGPATRRPEDTIRNLLGMCREGRQRPTCTCSNDRRPGHDDDDLERPHPHRCDQPAFVREGRTDGSKDRVQHFKHRHCELQLLPTPPTIRLPMTPQPFKALRKQLRAQRKQPIILNPVPQHLIYWAEQRPI